MSEEVLVESTVHAPDWERLVLVAEKDVRAFGVAMGDDIAKRVERGVSSDGRRVPHTWVKTSKARGRYTYADTSSQRRARDAARELAESGADAGKGLSRRKAKKAAASVSASNGMTWDDVGYVLDWDLSETDDAAATRARIRGAFKRRDGLPAYPMSVIQQMRTLGGHFEYDGLGTTFVAPDNIVRCGKDGARWGLTEGEIVAYQWNSGQSFLAANYGKSPGYRTGRMVKDIVAKVKSTGGDVLLTVGPKGPGSRKTPLFKILRESMEALADQRSGIKSRKFSSWKRMALIQRIGQSGKLAQDAENEIGVLEPSSVLLSDLMQRHVVGPLMERAAKLPAAEVK